jgi:AmmeMemoRadiSam system protein B
MKEHNEKKPWKLSLIPKGLLFLALICVFSCGLAGSSFGQEKQNADVFDPSRRIDWYPDDKDVLTQMVDSFLSNATAEDVGAKIRAVIAPHAGFQHSGQCAAYAFKPLMKQDINRVIILAPSHMGGFRGLSILKADYYGTPLGLIKVDTDICDSLLKEKGIGTEMYAHLREHSLDNLLPFLQRTLKNFRLVPILVGRLSEADYEPLATAIRNHIDKQTVVVVSSDFTHYGSYFGYTPFPLDENTRENIKKLDLGAITKILKLDFEGYQQYLSKTRITVCGRLPIGLLLNVLEQGVKGKLANYYMSGDRSGNYGLSVSYASILLYK